MHSKWRRLTSKFPNLLSGRDQETKKPGPDTEGATTVDVDKIWAELNSTKPPPTVSAQSQSEIGATSLLSSENNNAEDPPHASGLQDKEEKNNTRTGLGLGLAANTNTAPVADEEMITIKRTYKFAGETITEEKTVSKSSAEARLYLQTTQQQSSPSDRNSPQTTTGTTSKPAAATPLRRPKKRISMFEPPPPSSSEGGGVNATDKRKGPGPGPKLNTIEKSKLDWAGYVDQEGIKDELDVAEKSKDGYLAKRDFLDRVDTKRDLEIWSGNAKQR